jgi:hypothetical protein
MANVLHVHASPADSEKQAVRLPGIDDVRLCPLVDEVGILRGNLKASGRNAPTMPAAFGMPCRALASRQPIELRSVPDFFGTKFLVIFAPS